MIVEDFSGGGFVYCNKSLPDHFVIIYYKFCDQSVTLDKFIAISTSGPTLLELSRMRNQFVPTEWSTWGRGELVQCVFISYLIGRARKIFYLHQIHSCTPLHEWYSDCENQYCFHRSSCVGSVERGDMSTGKEVY